MAVNLRRARAAALLACLGALMVRPAAAHEPASAPPSDGALTGLRRSTAVGLNCD